MLVTARSKIQFFFLIFGHSQALFQVFLSFPGKYFAHSLTLSESEEDSEEENTLFDKKRLGNGNGPLNGNANGSVKLYKTHAM